MNENENNFSYLSDLEREKIDIFNNDPIMKNAVEKHLFADIYKHGAMKAGEKFDPSKNWALSFGQFDNGVTDAQLGENLRTYSWATNIVMVAWKSLKEVQKVVKPEVEQNQENPAI